jgi:hypothetical protein
MLHKLRKGEIGWLLPMSESPVKKICSFSRSACLLVASSSHARLPSKNVYVEDRGGGEGEEERKTRGRRRLYMESCDDNGVCVRWRHPYTQGGP